MKNSRVFFVKKVKILLMLLILVFPLISFLGNSVNRTIIDNQAIRNNAWQDIPLTDENGGPLYNYATACARTILFYDANRCGHNQGENRLNWRGDCHLNDSVTLALTDGSIVTIDLTGGYHDAGDHIKFGITQAYSASTLGWGLYEFREQFDVMGQADELLRAIKYQTDYYFKCHPEPNTFVYHVGSENDHSIWAPPELQLDKDSPRDVSYCNPDNPASDVCGSAAACLALMYLNYQSIDLEYAENCLQHAIDLYNLGKNYQGLSDGYGFYPSSSYYDDLTWGATWLYKATNDISYLDDVLVFISTLETDNNLENGIQWVNSWTHCWDVVWGGAFVVLAEITGDPLYIDVVEENLDYWSSNGMAETPGGLKYLNGWGVLRYTAAEALMALSYAKYSNNNYYRDFAASQMNYILGSNPINRCYIVGLGPNSAQHPHHRAAHGSETNSMDDPETHKHVLYGALVGGPGMDDQHNDVTSDYVQNEVTIDYNAAIVGALAGMQMFFAPEQIPEPDPEPEPEIEENYIMSKIITDDNQGIQVSCFINNHAIHPPRYDDTLSYRYFINLTGIYHLGYSIDNIIPVVYYIEGNAADVSDLQVFDDVNHIYFIELNYEGHAFYGDLEVQFGFIFRSIDNMEIFDSSYDFSRIGMTETLAKNYRIPMYRNGELLWGFEPVDDNIPPDSPTGLTAIALNPTQISLDWNDNIEMDVIKYRVYRSVVENFDPQISNLIGQCTTSQCLDENLTPLTTYYYKVTAVDYGNNEGTYSEEANARTLTPDDIPPAAPQNIIATPISAYQINLKWNDNIENDFLKYRVYRSLIDGFIPSVDNLVVETISSSYSDQRLNPETTYYYKVSAVDSSGNESPLSEQVSATTQARIIALRAQYKCGNTEDSTYDIRFEVNIYNDGDETLTLSDITFRYWFTSESLINTIQYACDYADLDNSNIIADFGTINNIDYLEIGILSTAIVASWNGGDGKTNTLPSNANIGNVQNRISCYEENFNQLDDYSFNAAMTDYMDNEQITIYYQGKLVWGIEPTTGPMSPNLNSPSDINYLEGDTGNSITWTATDDNLTTYTITRDGTHVDSGSYTSGESIIINVDGLSEGSYTYICTVSDADGNSDTDSVIVTVSPITTEWENGDVNHDNNVDIIDALLIAQYYVGSDPQPFYPEQADVNNDGNIDIVDALLVAQAYVGLIELP